MTCLRLALVADTSLTVHLSLSLAYHSAEYYRYSNDGSAATEPATEPTSDDYEALKAMANADNMVRSLSPLSFALYPHLCLRL